MAMTEAMKEVTRVARWLGVEQDLLKINCDSMSAIYLAKNQVYHVRTKHIDVGFHFVREILEEGDIELQKIEGESRQYAYQGYSDSEICTLQRVTP